MEIEETKAIRYLEWTQSQMRLGNLPPYNQDVYKSIDTLLNRLEQLEKENKELKANQCDHNISNECIRKSVIRDKIKELEKEKLVATDLEELLGVSKKMDKLKEILGEE